MNRCEPSWHVEFLCIRFRSERLWCRWSFATEECWVLLPTCSRIWLQQAATATASFSGQIFPRTFGHHTSSQNAQHLCKIGQDLMWTRPACWAKTCHCHGISPEVLQVEQLLVYWGTVNLVWRQECQFSRLGQHKNQRAWKKSRVWCFDSSHGCVFSWILACLQDVATAPDGTTCLRQYVSRLWVEHAWVEQQFRDSRLREGGG